MNQNAISCNSCKCRGDFSPSIHFVFFRLIQQMKSDEAPMSCPFSSSVCLVPLGNTQFTFVIVMLINSVALKKSSEHAVAVIITVTSWPAISFRTG